MQQSMGFLSYNLECPKCGQCTIVKQHQAHIYDCLNCRFRCAIAGDVKRSEDIVFGRQAWGWLDNGLRQYEGCDREMSTIAHH